MMLGLLLARAGVDVTVMEKHADFLRDFRGDTVHASTLRLLDELGLAAQFADIPHRLIDTVRLEVQGVPVDLDLRRLPGAHKHIALVPQWDFLELLASAAEAEPNFRLLRNTEVVGVIRGPENGGVSGAPGRQCRPWAGPRWKHPQPARRNPGLRGDGQGASRVTGVSYRDQGGDIKHMRATLTVACDGRSSTLRSAMGLVPRSFGAPMDVWWFRLPRRPDDPQGLAGVLGAGRATIVIDRGDYFQIAYVIPKGSDAELRAQGIETLRNSLVSMVPWMADRVGALTSFDDVNFLTYNSIGCPDGFLRACCSSGTRHMRCHRWAGWASTWR
jgi:2-polyprenyl-6-methoxyphenol hydroxylase-like FAD-dependent oxidoreductase